MKRKRPHEHLRRLRTGKKIRINKGRKKKNVVKKIIITRITPENSLIRPPQQVIDNMLNDPDISKLRNELILKMERKTTEEFRKHIKKKVRRNRYDLFSDLIKRRPTKTERLAEHERIKERISSHHNSQDEYNDSLDPIKYKNKIKHNLTTYADHLRGQGIDEDRIKLITGQLTKNKN